MTIIDSITDDGRILRRERNRENIVAALLSLYDKGQIEVSAAEIAGQAGLSERSLFRYFDDVNDLYRTACDAQFERISTFADLNELGRGSVAEKIEHFVDQRLRLFKQVGNIGRVARAHSHRVPAIDKQLGRGRKILRAQMMQHFEIELASLGRPERLAAVAGIDVLCSFESYELMRHDHGLSDSAIRSALTISLTKYLNSKKRTT
ncbi:MAG: TetR/AcrR family transcriptional regulator [Ilumatobacteraceae bacterium]